MRTANTKTLLAIFVFFLVTASAAVGKIIYVDVDANGLNDGSSWTHAYNYLQDALTDANSAAKPVEIRAAQGTYKPDQGVNQTPGNREASFQLINGVTIKGGYAGFGQPDPNARDIELYETILSGDLDANDIDVNDPRDLLYHPSRAENSYHVVTGSGNDATAVLDRATVTSGNANGHGRYFHGAGMYNSGGNPTLVDCMFTGNSADFDGGGMFNAHSSPVLTNCTLSANMALYGGGLSNYDSSPEVTNCMFIANVAHYCGGGIYERNSSNSTLTSCTVIDNTAELTGGGMCNYESDPTLINCIFTGNSTDYKGGGMDNYESDPTLTNCTFVDNSASQQGGGMHDDDSRPTLTNCVLWGNTPDEIYPEDDQPRITYSDVQGNWPGEGNINADPCFADPDNGDYHLKSQAGRWDPNSQTWVQDDVTSPCIDAGDMASPIGLEPFPNGGIINMGAYGGTHEASKSYFGEPVCETIVAGDINGDCIVDWKDFAFMALHWLQDENP